MTGDPISASPEQAKQTNKQTKIRENNSHEGLAEFVHALHRRVKLDEQLLISSSTYQCAFLSLL